ncbi:MAG: aminoacyl-tRNA hydrolase [Clostridia bacterium]|nr:aminoacyl-tRNA hydrolase [Clostridia bacterium]
MSNIFDLFKQISAGRETASPAGVEWIVAGLGNPGREYTFTRHNTGFLCLGYIAEKLGVSIERAKFRGLTARAEISGRGVLLLCPVTYMNCSGESIREAAEYYKVPPEKILVILDDINLPPGRLRYRTSGSAGGHNGLKSIIYQLQSDSFPRMRIGVGSKPAEGMELVDWVLSRFTESELAELRPAFDRIYEALPAVVEGRTDEAQRICNSRNGN